MVNALKMFNVPLCNIQLGYGRPRQCSKYCSKLVIVCEVACVNM